MGEALFAGDDFEGVEDGEGLEDAGLRGKIGFGGDAFDAVGGAGEGDGAVADDGEGIGEGFGEEGAEGDGGEGGFGGDFRVFAETDGTCERAGAAGGDGEVGFGDDGAVFGDGEGAFADAEPVEPALAEVAAAGEDIEAIGGALGDDDRVGEVACGGRAGAPCEVEVAGGEAVEGELAEVRGDPEACGEERGGGGGELGGFLGSDDWDGGSGTGAEVGGEGEGGDIAEVPCLAEEGFEACGGGDFFGFESGERGIGAAVAGDFLDAEFAIEVHGDAFGFEFGAIEPEGDLGFEFLAEGFAAEVFAEDDAVDDEREDDEDGESGEPCEDGAAAVAGEEHGGLGAFQKFLLSGPFVHDLVVALVFEIAFHESGLGPGGWRRDGGYIESGGRRFQRKGRGWGGEG